MQAITEVVVGDAIYSIGPMPAMQAFHIVRRLAPVVPALAGAAAAGKSDVAAIGPLADAIAALSDADAEYIIYGCLSVVRYKEPAGNGWSLVKTPGQNTLQRDLDMVTMLQLVRHVFAARFKDFMSALPSGSGGASLKA